MTAIETGSALLTDLYELTMAAGYFERRLTCRATFELFVRARLPQRGFLVACGLESALAYLENLRFTEDEIAFLREHPVFRTVSSGFFDFLRELRFTGDVSAIPEGTIVFAEEPLLQVTAPITEAQIIETYLLSVLSFETLVATKSARVVRAAAGKDVLEFGARRAHGPAAGIRAARAAYVGGCHATSNVLAGSLFGIPLAGTAAHSWTQAFPSERESFVALLDCFPDSAILLIDTYDTVSGAETAAVLGRKISGVRLDSGDLLQKSREVRQILDRHGHRETRIVASGDLDEFKIAELIAAGAPIDSFGVGTEIVTSRDAPALGMVYKLVESEEAGRVEYKTKFSEEKSYSPGPKQVFRFASGGRFHHDLITRAEESCPGAEPLLEAVMRQGQRITAHSSLEAVRARARENIKCLPDEYQTLKNAAHYPVQKSEALQRLWEETRVRHFAEK
jgi:nicotinate phosphoribosyltransferase